MNVKLVSYSQPSKEYLDKGLTNVQELIAFCARVSNPSNQFNALTADKLIRYLIKHKHWSPLEMASACIEISTTRDIARQILRHRSFAFQEFSQRYSDPTSELTFVLREARLQDNKNRQNSFPLDLTVSENATLNDEWLAKQQEVITAAQSAYSWAISKGIAKEVARAVLPEGNTGSKLYVSGTIRSMIHFVDVRTEESTQLEHRLIAKGAALAINEIFPMINEFVH